MKIINLENWAESISKYLLKYMYNVKYKQYIQKIDTDEYNNIAEQCKIDKNNLLECINNIENYNLLEVIEEDNEDTLIGKEIERFKKELRKGEVKFKYYKVNGDIRDAVGTLNPDIIGKENMPNGDKEINYSDYNIRYFDLEKKDWRSFKVSNLISIIYE